MSGLIPPALPHVAKLRAYTPGLQPTDSGWTKLNTNECPYPPSPRVGEAIKRDLGADGASLRLYPNPKSGPLRAELAKLHGVTDAQVVVGNGSDDILNLLVRAYCSAESGTGFTFPSYSLYPILIEIQNGHYTTIDFDRAMRLPVERISQSTAPIFFLTSPNAPTGAPFTNAELEQVLTNYRGLLVVDEAYALFAQETALPLLARYPNLVIVRTLSKAYALAGIRVGYALAHPEVIDVLDRVRDSYNVNRLSQIAAVAAVADGAYYAQVVARIKATRDASLHRFKNAEWFTYPSQTNFIFTEPKTAGGETGAIVAKSAYDFLLARKVLVRYFASHALTASFLRISVGTDDEMLVLHQTLDAWQKTLPNA
ncbi:MAG: histidinol-phosphate transaminase [Opitutus sp.]